MNVFEIDAVRGIAKQKSKGELNHDKLVFALIKNGSHFSRITADEKEADRLVECLNYSIWGIFKNGVEIPVNSYTRISWRS